ncbi:MAG: PspC domain-containing protein [Thermoanaerobaculia bacterium]|nr:PspC domain-containing protein [Thermoanaerobaculia bacterium]
MASPSLYRSSSNAVIAGVCGGIARRFGLNTTLVRILFVLVSILSAAFPGIIVYLVLWVLMPKGA